MKKQSYSNHVRWYVPHHFIFYPVAIGLIAFAVRFAFRFPDRSLEWSAIAIVLTMITWLSFMMRQHYALNNQNRIIRLEMRLRYYQLTHQRFDDIEARFSIGQIAALRFASDAELVALVNRSLAENLSPKNIKRSIKSWQADDMRA